MGLRVSFASLTAALLAAHAAAADLNGVMFQAYGRPNLYTRHCDFQVYGTELGISFAADYQWIMQPALNGNASGVSFSPFAYPAQFLVPTQQYPDWQEPLRLGFDGGPDPDDASWLLVPGLANSSFVSLQSMSKNATYAGKYMTLVSSLTGGCPWLPNASMDVALADEGDIMAQTWIPLPTNLSIPVAITVHASNITHAINPRFMGCHSDTGYVHQARGLYSQMVVGDAFPWQFPWVNITSGTAGALFDGDPSRPYQGFPGMRIQVVDPGTPGDIAGISNRGLGNQGMVFEGGKPYEGYAYVRWDGSSSASAGAPSVVDAATGALNVTFALRDYTATPAPLTLAAASFAIAPSASWQRVNFTFTPAANTTCVGIVPGEYPDIPCEEGPTAAHVCMRCGGELLLSFQTAGLAPGDGLNVGFVFLQPGAWGRYKGLPVLASGVAALQAMGVTLVRQGGSFSRDIDWADWRGPVWQRASLQQLWGPGPCLIAGFGPFDMADLCEAAGWETVMTMDCDNQTADDWANFVEYAFGNASSTYGALRIADGHPAPYATLRNLELGNEEDNDDFVAQVAAMEARAAALGLPAGTVSMYLYPTNQGVNSSQAAQLQALENGALVERIAVDVHVGGTGGVEVSEAAFAALPTFNQSAVNMETNAASSDMQRALDEAADLNDWFSVLPPVLPRLYARAASFCMESATQWDNGGWDQGLVFFAPNATWFAPPGYVHVMIADTWADNGVEVLLSTVNVSAAAPASAATAAGTASGAATRLLRGRAQASERAPAAARLRDNGDPVSVSAQRSADGGTLVVRITNSWPNPLTLTLDVPDVTLGSTARLLRLSSAGFGDVNTVAQPTRVSPVSAAFPLALPANITLPPISYSVYSFNVLQ